jgi:hypothetical protein
VAFPGFYELLEVIADPMRISKNGRATTIPTHSMSSRSNMPSVASQPPQRCQGEPRQEEAF